MIFEIGVPYKLFISIHVMLPYDYGRALCLIGVRLDLWPFKKSFCFQRMRKICQQCGTKK